MTMPVIPRLTTSLWFALGRDEDAREQIRRHLSRYMNRIPPKHVECDRCPRFAGTEGELVAVLAKFADIGADQVALIPTSCELDQLRRVADAVSALKQP